jgi:peptidoglycan/LPS O-acetylase OafA/YrhL
LLILLLLGASSENFNFSFIFFTQSFIGSHPDFFGVTWSLAVEEWFYFLFPLLLFFLFKVSKNKNTTLVISISFFLLLPMILRHLKYHDFNFLAEAHYRKTTIFRFDSLMFGVITSVIYSKYNSYWNKYASLTAFLGIGILIMVSTFKKSLLNIPSFENLIFFYLESIPIALLLPFFSKINTLNSKILDKSVVFISKISYSVYLTHGSLVLWFLLRNLEQTEFLLSFRFELQRAILYFLYVSLTLIFSVMLYLFIEKPIMNYRDKVTKS